MKISTTYLAVIIFTLVASSCGMVGQDAVMVPSYVCVPSFTFVTDSVSAQDQGAPSQAFNDMWISKGGELLGGIGVPSLIPVQSIGATELRVDPGISITGQNDKRRAYPLVATHTEVRIMRAGVIDTIKPVFRYLPNADFKFIEDYDRITHAFKFNPTYYEPGDTVLPVNDNRAWNPGTYSGKVEFSASRKRVQLITDQAYPISGQGAPAYLEIDFKSNITLDIGYYYLDPNTGASSAMSVIELYPTSTWKKIYVDLTDEVSSRTLGTTYIIYIGFLNDYNVIPDVYIDNIKLIGLKG